MSIADDIDESINRAVSGAKEQTVWSGVIVTTNPLTVQFDGSGVATDCLAGDFVSLVEQRRCVVQQVGSQFVVMQTFGGARLNNYSWGLNSVAVQGATASGFNIITAFHAPSVPSDIVFIAPPSGKVLIWVSARFQNVSNVAVQMYASFELREGATVGSGTITLAPDGSRSFASYHNSGSVSTYAGSYAHPMYNLIPGLSYNCRLLQWSSDAANNHLLVAGCCSVAPIL